MSSTDFDGDSAASLRDEFTRKLRLVCLTHGSRVLLQDRKRSLTGRELMLFFAEVKSELDRLTPVGAKVAICCRDSFLQAQLILATFYSGRVPAVFTCGKHEDLLDAQSRLGIAAVLEQADLSWPVSPVPHRLLFSTSGELREHRLTSSVEPVTAAHPECGLILFTSGTMGNQKAVNVPLRGMLNTYDWLARHFSLTEDDVSTLILPISHTFALNTQLMPAFLVGAKTVFLNRTLHLGRQYELIGKFDGTFVASVGDLLRLLKRERDVRGLPSCLRVRHVQVAGGKITLAHLHELRELFPNAVLHKGYGMTETIRTSMVSSEDPDFYSESCGKPLPGQEIRVIDENGVIVPPGELGEIHVRSASTLVSYDQQPAFSALDRDGFFATGDWGYVKANGHLACVDRLDRVFKIAGKKVSALELELAAADFDQVEVAKCAPIVDEKRGIRPVLFIETSEASPETLRLAEFESSLRERLEPAKVPRDVVISEKLPRTANSKVKINALQELWEKKHGLLSIPAGSGFIRFHVLLTKEV